MFGVGAGFLVSRFEWLYGSLSRSDEEVLHGTEFSIRCIIKSDVPSWNRVWMWSTF